MIYISRSHFIFTVDFINLSLNIFSFFNDFYIFIIDFKIINKFISKSYFNKNKCNKLYFID